MKLFTAQWCGPCKSLKQWLEDKGIEVVKFGEEVKDGAIEIVDIDTDEGGELASAAGVRGIPALHDGENLIVTNEKIRPHLESLNV